MIPRRILVTGAGGFVGRFLLPALQAACPAASIGGLDGLDITDRDGLFAHIAAVQPDLCVHLAGISAIGRALDDPGRAWAVNLHGSINLADAILANAAHCRLMFISTAEVYGASFKSGLALDETAPLQPLNLYAATKAAAEMALTASTAQGLRLLRLRPFNHTGPGQTEAFVVPAFAGQIARIEAGLIPPVIAVGALTPARDFLDVRDVCAAYTAAALKFDSLPDNTILNIASGRPARIGAILDLLLAQSRQAIEIRADPAKLRPVEIATAIGDAGAAGRLLGWSPQTPSAATFTAVLDHARAMVQGAVVSV